VDALGVHYHDRYGRLTPLTGKARERESAWDLVGWSLAALVVAFAGWLFALLRWSRGDWVGACGDVPGGAHTAGGLDIGAATLFAAGLWLGATVVAALFRRRLGLLFVAFVALYVVGLVLFDVLPGPVQCVPDSAR
jgi:hypothetical protein